MVQSVPYFKSYLHVFKMLLQYHIWYKITHAHIWHFVYILKVYKYILTPTDQVHVLAYLPTYLSGEEKGTY